MQWPAPSRARLWWLAAALLLVVALLSVLRLWALESAWHQDAAHAAAGLHQAQRQRIVLEGLLMLGACLLLAGSGELLLGRRAGAGAGPVGPSPDPLPERSTQPGDGAQQIAGLLAAAGPRMRQPLQALSLFTGSLTQDARPAQRQALQGMQASVRELASVIDEIDQLLHWLHRDLPLDAVALPVEALLDALRPDMAQLAEEHAVQVHWHGSGLALASDPELAARLLRALVGNAVRSARQRVLVAARPGARQVRLQVRDDGPAFALAQAVPLAQLLQESQDVHRRAAGLGVAAGVAGVLGMELTVRSPPTGGNVLEAGFPRVPDRVTPDNAALLSLALLQAEAREGRRPRSQLGDAPAGTEHLPAAHGDRGADGARHSR